MRNQTAVVWLSVLLALVTGCSKSFRSESSGSTESSSYQAGGGTPFDGKHDKTYQYKDAEFCYGRSTGYDLRYEVVQHEGDYWITVEDCMVVSARRVNGEVSAVNGVHSIDFRGVTLVNRAFETLLLLRPYIECFGADGDRLASVARYNGDFLSYFPRFSEDFYPGISEREASPVLNGVKYAAVYRTTYKNQVVSGVLSLYVKSETPGGDTYGVWKFEGYGPGYSDSGKCRIYSVQK